MVPTGPNGWPSNNGFDPDVPTAPKTLNPGDILQRYGRSDGHFLSDPGATPQDLSLEPGHAAYDGEPPSFWTPNGPTPVESGPAASVAWPGGPVTPGGATQYFSKTPIENAFTQLSADDLEGMDIGAMTEEQYLAWQAAIEIATGN